ncbi:hypothetical protein [Streptomyces sp. NRRL B-1347]|uniref:hypothetical protein n=1 Tax=Streptomyces sp. NRRL B-1347 TaxID=1476877 RepID=UPI0004C5906B|nr:hypothetical protein [Streptomyces sp. NRRL B-1347]
MVPPCSSPPWQNTDDTCESGLFQASTAASEGFNDTFTWVALLTAIGIVVAAVHRWRDKRAKLLEKDYVVLDKVVVELDTLQSMTATHADLDGLRRELSLVKQAAKRFPKIPFGTVVATVEAYQTTVLSTECAKRLTKRISDKKSVTEALDLSRQQGAKIADIRAAVNTAQRIIDRRLRR